MAEKLPPPISLRLPRETYTRLEMIAAGERSTVSDVIRLAIDQYLNPHQKGKA